MKVIKLSMKPKIYSILSNLLHTRVVFNNIYPQIGDPLFLESTKMDFYIRKVLKYSGIPYFYNRSKRTLTINSKASTLRLFMVFDEFGVTVRKIPWDNYTYFFQSCYPQMLFDKLVEKGVITRSEAKKLIVPIHIDLIGRPKEKAPS